jgi:hypothetical protein
MESPDAKSTVEQQQEQKIRDTGTDDWAEPVESVTRELEKTTISETENEEDGR